MKMLKYKPLGPLSSERLSWLIWLEKLTIKIALFNMYLYLYVLYINYIIILILILICII